MVIFDSSHTSSHRCYCNTQFAGLPSGQTARLVSFLHAAAWCILHLPRYSPVSAAIQDMLQWLSFQHDITYKLCLMTYKCLHGLVLTYLSRYFVPLASVPGCCQLRSADLMPTNSTPQTLTSTLGPRSFSVSGPASWMALLPGSRTLICPQTHSISCSRLLYFPLTDMLNCDACHCDKWCKSRLETRFHFWNFCKCNNFQANKLTFSLELGRFNENGRSSIFRFYVSLFPISDSDPIFTGRQCSDNE